MYYFTYLQLQVQQGSTEMNCKMMFIIESGYLLVPRDLLPSVLDSHNIIGIMMQMKG
jgi:uncharacterized membrane protein YkvA (DUF1232 family)